MTTDNLLYELRNIRDSLKQEGNIIKVYDNLVALIDTIEQEKEPKELPF